MKKKVSKKKIYVSGHTGMVGSAIVRFLEKDNNNIEIITKKRNQLNLLNQAEVLKFFQKKNIDEVYLAAAKVGGIYANDTYPAEFIYENLMIQTNIIHSAFLSGVKKLLFLGSSCIYPKNAKQPMKEDELFNGKLELTNEPYAIAKIAGIKMCESYNRQYGLSNNIDYRCIMPTNLYGPGNNYHPENSHVIAALIHRFHQSKILNKEKIMIWGSGNARREFLYVDDMARASIYLMKLDKDKYDKYISPRCSHINVGSGLEISIRELAQKIKKTVGYRGEVDFDLNKPDGSPRKLMDSRTINSLGFKSQITLNKGLLKTYKDYLKLNANS